MKTKKTLFDKPISITILIFAFVLLFVSVRFFYMGFGNVDSVYNYQNIALEATPYFCNDNISFVSVFEAEDIMLSGKVITLSEGYGLGFNQMVIGFHLMFFAGLLFTIGIIKKH